jgi:hypothetical protein
LASAISAQSRGRPVANKSANKAKPTVIPGNPENIRAEFCSIF